MSKRKKRLGYVFLTLLSLCGIITYLVYQGAPYLIIKPRKVHYNKKPADFGMKAEAVSWKTEDRLNLKGWATFPDQGDTLPVVIFLHGIGNSKESWVNTAEWLYKEGFAAIAFDGRAHGESDGEFCTFGFHEKKDVANIVAWAKETYPNRPIGIWGNSLGGAIALQSLEYEEDIDFGVVTSTFADLKEVVYAYQKRYFLGFESKSLADNALARASYIADFDPEKIKPEGSASHIEQPIFLAHGTADARINVENANRIFNNLPSLEKELHLIKGAGHMNMWMRGGNDYRRDLMAFLKRQIK